MNNVFWHNAIFWFFAVLTCASAIGVVIAGRVVHMAICLLISLAATAMLFFSAGAALVGTIQLLVYVGGTMVLLVFGVMLTSREPVEGPRAGAGQVLSALLVAAALGTVLWHAGRGLTVLRTINKASDSGLVVGQRSPTDELGLALLGVRTDTPTDRADQRGLLPGYLLPFELVSIHLLAALIGAAYLARARRSRVGPQPQLPEKLKQVSAPDQPAI